MNAALVTDDPTIIVVGSRTLPITDADVARFWRKVDKSSPNSCWIWTATRCRQGYGRFWVGGYKVLAHRFAYVLAGNDLDPALQLDHLCHVHACVNPCHLRQVTNAENGANRAGATVANLSSGIRGVSWHRQASRWQTQAQLRGRRYFAGLHDSIESAELAAIQLRERLGMANAADLRRLAELHCFVDAA